MKMVVNRLMSKMYKIARLGLVIWIACLVSNLSGQENASFRYLSKKDGLSQTSVFCISQDSTGLMWFGTRDGLNKYDGYQFKVYKKEGEPNSIASNDIQTLYFDSQKNELWIGTNAGLSKYRSKTDDFLSFFHSSYDTSSISNNYIRQIIRDTKGQLWVGTANGLNLLDEKTNTFKRFYFKDPFTKNNEVSDVEALLVDNVGSLWVGTASGMYNLSAKKKEDFTIDRIDPLIEQQLSDTHIKNILEDDKGNFWIGTFKGGINYWDKKNKSVTVFRNKENDPVSLSHNNVRSMCLDEKGNLWVGTFDGLNYLEKGKTSFERFEKASFGKPGLSHNSIRSVFIDRRGSLWLGTFYGGINHMDENYNQFINIKHAPQENVLSSNIVSSFAEDVNENIYIGTEGGGLNFYSNKTKKFENYQFQPNIQNSLSGNNVKELLLDGDELWIGTFQAGLNVFNTKTKQFKHFKNTKNVNALSNNNVYALHKDAFLLWIGTYGGGIDILDLKEKKFYNFKHKSSDVNSISSDLTRVILKTKGKQFWIGTEKGLNKIYLNAVGFPERFEVFLADEKIYSLHEDNQGIIWVGTFTNGIYRFNSNKNTFEHYTDVDGLAGNSVFGILEAEDGVLWLSTNNGLSKFNTKASTFTNYNYSNGLENSEYNFNAYYKTESGDFLFGGINGFTQFDPRDIQPNEFIPPVIFTELRKNNQLIRVGDDSDLLKANINETESLTFDYNQANFSVGFAALDYFSPENNHYAFMLEGIDNDWNYSVGKTDATYTIQREGEYTFRLKGGNSNGLWNPNERRLYIKVLPPPWRTWWAYLIYLGIIGLIGFGILRFIRLRHSLQLEQIAKQQQEELNEVKLRFFTNITHEFRTPLTLILGPLKDLMASEQHSEQVDKRLSLIHRNTQRLLNLVNQVLTFRKLATDHEPLNIESNNLIEFLREIFLPFQESAHLRNIHYSFKTDEETIAVWYDQDKLEKVFFNLLSNAFKFTPDGGEIVMSISQNERYVEIKVIDDGVGVDSTDKEQIFKRFYEKSDSSRSAIKGTGIGLAISKQMVELHHGKIFVENSLHTPSGQGATFVVQIPKGNSHFDKSNISEVSSPESISNYQPIINNHDNNFFNDNKEERAVDENAPLLLIVEDNQEILNYIEHIFSKKYRISTAKNGKIGIEKAKKELPTLIISDVMMPEMDGITFCGKVKSNLEISHIPVILLTARTASLFKIEGLKIGADDYITKPFNPEELQLRVQNMIQARQEVRDKFARVLSFDPKEITITSADEVFLEKALRIVEDEMENYGFNVEQFAFKLAVSRPLLFTKLKALTGQTPNNFIKTIRLKRATQLIKTKKLNISEIAHKVGFKDPKYFRKCFKAQFNMSPSDFELADID